jgi:8-oxo-dGTP pyrophosphatase MutT (NUDIX family)
MNRAYSTLAGNPRVITWDSCAGIKRAATYGSHAVIITPYGYILNSEKMQRSDEWKDWNFAGGTREQRDPTPWDTLVRELGEELGLKEKMYRYVNHTMSIGFTPGGKMAVSVLFIVLLDNMSFEKWYGLPRTTKVDILHDLNSNEAAFRGRIKFRDFHQRHLTSLPRMPIFEKLVYVCVDLFDDLHVTIGDYIAASDIEEVMELVIAVKSVTFTVTRVVKNFAPGIEEAALVVADVGTQELVENLTDLTIPGWDVQPRVLHVSKPEQRRGVLRGLRITVRIGDHTLMSSELSPGSR